MSQGNVETVARLYNECWSPGKLELVPEILHPDVVWTAIESAPDSDGRLVCALHGVGTEKRTGLTTNIRYGAAFGFAPDGRLVEIHEYATHQEALEAVGLSE